ncbi:hypothetical protein KP509_24G015400 [Ceratopteris richardii]|uniref:Secreted protein n=1 Tax=Ceratopteris richardii TaxID=49495 RepID=A0A8T2RSN4_CERRI|nr:hypothetical protein KP509_24G015400 [Ceratopteris richardii]
MLILLGIGISFIELAASVQLFGCGSSKKRIHCSNSTGLQSLLTLCSHPLHPCCYPPLPLSPAAERLSCAPTVIGFIWTNVISP